MGRMPSIGTPPPHARPDIIRHLGRTICVGVLIPWFMSSVMQFDPVFFVGVVLALLVPRLVVRRLKAPVRAEWSQRDWAWSAVALVIAIAYFAGLTPGRFAMLVGW